MKLRHEAEASILAIAPSMAMGSRLAFDGLRWPSMAFDGLRWLWAAGSPSMAMGSRWLWAAGSGVLRTSFAAVARCGPLSLSFGRLSHSRVHVEGCMAIRTFGDLSRLVLYTHLQVDVRVLCRARSVSSLQ